MLTLQNRKARGKDRYEVHKRPKGVSWASQNMFVIGSVVAGFLVLHLSQFWYKMMFAELLGYHEVTLCSGAILHPQDGAAFINYYFSQCWVVIAYLIWYVALWFHLTHGVWSAFQTIGWSDQIWLKRLKLISNIVATLIFLSFAFVTLFFHLKNLCCFSGSCC
jgi:succinate dehydrogenase / fumarate reductase cytochrome b subunit